MSWHVQTQYILLPKAGSKPSECEDSIGVRTSAHRFCVADGATEAFDSRRWARLLTKNWVFSNRELLNETQLLTWGREVAVRFRRRWEQRVLPWYAEEKARSGSFAAFLGLMLFEGLDGISWQSVAIGDACLIQKRAGTMLLSFPLSDASQFGFHPSLFPSDVGRQETALESLEIRNGKALAGDVFFLLTDAIAAWYLSVGDAAPQRVEAFETALATNDLVAVKRIVDDERTHGSLRNDDVAAVRIAIGRAD